MEKEMEEELRRFKDLEKRIKSIKSRGKKRLIAYVGATTVLFCTIGYLSYNHYQREAQSINTIAENIEHTGKRLEDTFVYASEALPLIAKVNQAVGAIDIVCSKEAAHYDPALCKTATDKFNENLKEYINISRYVPLGSENKSIPAPGFSY